MGNAFQKKSPKKIRPVINLGHAYSTTGNIDLAVEYFEKGKKQNYLMQEHTDKIINTYQYRKEEDRYSKRVSLEEIEQNDYNLNISRYVSTV